jgi:hypothetical protein
VISTPPRTLAERTRDTLDRLNRDVDAWVASADSSSGTPHLIPLSYLWDGATLRFSTPLASLTTRNVRATGSVRLGIGPTRDLVLIEGIVSVVPDTDISTDIGDAFAAKTGFDPRQLTQAYGWLRVLPIRIQAWREADELEGRLLMRDGVWLVT